MGRFRLLGPDGKSQVTVEYAYGKPVRVDTVVISTQHLDAVDARSKSSDDVMRARDRSVVPANLLDKNTKILYQPDRAFCRRRSAGRCRT